MRPLKYILEGHTPVPTEDWAACNSAIGTPVARTEVNGAVVSTVFLAIDAQLWSSVPTLFETMVFGGPLDREQLRYRTWDEAEKGHAEMVALVLALPKP